MKKTPHWTEGGTQEFRFRVAFDFVAQVQDAMEDQNLKQRDLAELLGLTEGRVSQVFNNPGNMTLQSMIDWGRRLGRKVSVVLYDDNDHANCLGPIDSDVFRISWERQGKPRDRGDLDGLAWVWVSSRNARSWVQSKASTVIQGPWIGCEKTEPRACDEPDAIVLNA